jgi:hypothetical protein
MTSKSKSQPSKQKKRSQKAGAPKPEFLTHRELLAPMSAVAEGGDLPFLGHARAVVTVCTCANSSPTNLFSTLNDLGVNGISFQQCVFGSVVNLGYSIGVDSIPDAPTSTLISVVDIIQNAPKA